jgi:hypothetical protein
MFVGFLILFLLGILIFKWLTAWRLYKSYGVKGLMDVKWGCSYVSVGLYMQFVEYTQEGIQQNAVYMEHGVPWWMVAQLVRDTEQNPQHKHGSTTKPPAVPKLEKHLESLHNVEKSRRGEGPCQCLTQTLG